MIKKFLFVLNALTNKNVIVCTFIIIHCHWIFYHSCWDEALVFTAVNEASRRDGLFITGASGVANCNKKSGQIPFATYQVSYFKMFMIPDVISKLCNAKYNIFFIILEMLALNWLIRLKINKSILIILLLLLSTSHAKINQTTRLSHTANSHFPLSSNK